MWLDGISAPAGTQSDVTVALLRRIEQLTAHHYASEFNREVLYGGQRPRPSACNYRSFTPAQHEAAGEALLANLAARGHAQARSKSTTSPISSSLTYPAPTPSPGQAALDLMLHGNAFVIAGSPAHEEMLETAHLRNEMVRSIEIWQERR